MSKKEPQEAILSEEVGEATVPTQADEYMEKWQRAMADLENQRKRHDQEKQAVRQYGLEGMITDLLPVVDNFYRATEHVPDEQKSSSWVVGIQYIQKQLLDVLSNNGVEEIAVKPGDAFNPERHEALEAVESDAYESEHVIEVKIKGYLLNGRVIRPAQVTVSK